MTEIELKDLLWLTGITRTLSMMNFKTVASRIPKIWLVFTTISGKLLLKRNAQNSKKYLPLRKTTLMRCPNSSPRRRDKK